MLLNFLGLILSALPILLTSSCSNGAISGTSGAYVGDADVNKNDSAQTTTDSANETPKAADSKGTSSGASVALDYEKDVKGIVSANCSCHLASMSPPLATKENLLSSSAAVVSAIEAGRMPPSSKDFKDKEGKNLLYFLKSSK